MGINKNQSRYWQAVAELPEDLFEEHLAQIRKAKKELTSACVYRKAFEFRRVKEADAKPLVGADSVKTPIRIPTGTGNFMDYIDKYRDVVDAIITDPPYGKEHLHLFGKLGQFAAKVLKPGGSLLAMADVQHLPAVLALMTPHLTYQWAICYYTPGALRRVKNLKVMCAWKPVLWFVNGKYKGKWVSDVCRSVASEKEHHQWQQSESGIAELVEKFTQPGDKIIDPLFGSGTLGEVAIKLNRNFLGIEIDPKTLEAAEKRLERLAKKIVLPSYFPDKNPADILDNWEKQGNNGDETDKMRANSLDQAEPQEAIPDDPPFDDFIPTGQPGVYRVKLKGQKPEEPKAAEASQKKVRKFSGWDKVEIEKQDGTKVEAIAPVIISASRRTDLPAYHSEWFMNRLKQGYLINNWSGDKITSFAKTRVIVFWTNPHARGGHNEG